MTRALWTIVGLATAIKLVVAFASFGTMTDIEFTVLVLHQLIDGNPFDAYTGLPTEPVPGWPYPPGFFPFVVFAGGLARLLPGGFHGWIQVAPIAADAALAVLVARILAARGRSPRVQLAGAGLVALGPAFAITSGYSFQIDAVAALPALLAAHLWDTRAPGRRALAAGLLIGVAACVKSPLGLVLLALLPTARDAREAATTAAWVVAVPLAALAPFLAVAPSATLGQVLGHEAVAGQAMLSAVVDPDVTSIWVTNEGWPGYHSTLAGWAPVLLAAIAAGVIALGLRRRPPAISLAIVLWLALWAFGSGFFFHYLIWGLPFMLVAGLLWEAAALQVFAAGALLVLWTIPHGQSMLTAYRVWVYALLAFTIVLLVRTVRTLPARTDPGAPPGSRGSRTPSPAPGTPSASPGPARA